MFLGVNEDPVGLACQERMEKGGAIFSVVLKHAETARPVGKIYTLRGSSAWYKIDKSRVKLMRAKGQEEDGDSP